MSLPDLYVFNPTCEIAVANGSETYMAPEILRRFESDLSIIQLVFCRAGDYLLGSSPIADDHRKLLQSCGFPVPEVIGRDELMQPDGLRFHALIPWGWSPAAHFQNKAVKEHCSEAFRQSVCGRWTEDFRQLYERGTSALFLNSLLSNMPANPLFPAQLQPRVIHSAEEASLLLKEYGQLVLKAPLSSSGRGVQLLRNRVLNRSNMQWIDSVLKQQSYLMAERLFDKQVDCSFQFWIGETGKVHYLGHTLFQTNSNGMYMGTWLGKTLDELLPFPGSDITTQTLDDTAALLQTHLQQSVYSQHYCGYLGVDGLVATENGQMKLHPCLEINSRMTMGLVALKVAELIHPKASGQFRVYSEKEPFTIFCRRMLAINPPQNADGRFVKGFLPLTAYSGIQQFGAYVLLD